MVNPKEISKYPTKPGVYLMKDKDSRILYIGKAKNIKKRLTQYFITKTDTRETVYYLLLDVQTVDFIVVTNEKEALLLENNLIKKHKPKYNILLKDDKTYVSLMITNHKWPALKLMRFKKTPNDKNKYFGPYTSVKAARDILDLILKIFPLRQCSDNELTSRKRVCLLYDIKKCLGPCLKKCTQKEYDKCTQKVSSFLRGKDKTILKDLEHKMKKASDDLEFEKANTYLNLIKDIQHLMQKQFVDILSSKNTDAIGLYRQGTSVLISRLMFVEGKLTYSEHYSFSQIIALDEDIIETFLLQNYIHKKAPSEILLPINIFHKSQIQDLIKTKILTPQKALKKDLVDLANNNAKALFEQEKDQKSLREKQLLELQETLNLNNFPKVIQCFDTSNIAHSDPVAAMVTFTNGLKDKKNTKLFKIKTEQLGDVPAMREVLHRHFVKQKELNSFCDLLILDGGRAQLNAAIKVLNDLEIASIDIIGLTKEKARHDKGLTKEKLYIPHKKDPIFFDPRSPLLFLLQHIRDESHRVAISFHIKRRSKRTISSSLDQIPGIGPKKKKELLKHFKSIKNLKKASRQDLEKLKILSSSDIKKILGF